MNWFWDAFDWVLEKAFIILVGGFLCFVIWIFAVSVPEIKQRKHDRRVEATVLWKRWVDYRNANCTITEKSYGLTVAGTKNNIYRDGAIGYKCGDMTISVGTDTDLEGQVCLQNIDACELHPANVPRM